MIAISLMGQKYLLKVRKGSHQTSTFFFPWAELRKYQSWISTIQEGGDVQFIDFVWKNSKTLLCRMITKPYHTTLPGITEVNENHSYLISLLGCPFSAHTLRERGFSTCIVFVYGFNLWNDNRLWSSHEL